MTPVKAAAVRARHKLRHLAAVPTLAALAGCGGVMDPAGPVGAGDRQIMLNALAIMLAIVVPTILAALGFAWWFRAGNTRAEYRPDWAFSGRLELIVWSIPILVVIFLGGVIWIGSHRLDPDAPISTARPLEVQVVSLDWKWLFLYPEQRIASVNRLVVPVGRPIHLTLTSASVFNGFFVPRLGSMIYVMNGMVSRLNLQADKPGAYPGASTHFSGDGFSNMTFTADAVPTAQFDGWIAGAKGRGAVLDRAAYEALARPSLGAARTTYRDLDPRLFGAIATGALPAPGPHEGPPVSPRVTS